MADSHITPICVQFLGTHNSARSRPAEALLLHDSGDRSDIDSTGALPDGGRQRCIV
jgi:protein-tyrosine-phosphatase